MQSGCSLISAVFVLQNVDCLMIAARGFENAKLASVRSVEFMFDLYKFEWPRLEPPKLES